MLNIYIKIIILGVHNSRMILRLSSKFLTICQADFVRFTQENDLSDFDETLQGS